MDSVPLLFVKLLLVFHCVNSARANDEEVEVVVLPMTWGTGNATVPLSFRVFGEKVDLTLERNEYLLSPDFEVWKREGDDVLKKVHNFSGSASCHYLHRSSVSSAAISLCDVGTVHGFVFLENDSLEITPLSNEDSHVLEKHRIKVRSSSSFGEPHVIKKRRIPYQQGEAHMLNSQRFTAMSRQKISPSKAEDKPSQKVTPDLTLELAVFFDETAYRLFHPYTGDESHLADLVLAYVNNIQALYYHPSLGQRVNVVLVRLELMQRQPKQLASLDGERGDLLDTFCAYAKSINPPGDNDPKHWDMGLYISGLDFYAVEEGKKNYVTMGLAPVGGVCWDEYACVIAEFGVTNHFGRPYPSAGFTSVYIAAHEIAHNLGMHHDSSNNSCPRDGFIMSPSRGVEGEAQWSSCSRDLVATLPTTKFCLLDGPSRRDSDRLHLDHSSRFSELPGRRWTAKRQCEVLLRDKEAYAVMPEGVCQKLKCKTPKKTGFFFAGPALDGTKCAVDKECRAGECLLIENRWQEVPLIPTPSPPSPGWSEWSDGRCTSACIRGSLGFIERRRTCLGDYSCSGQAVDVSLCKDAHLCEHGDRKRLSVAEYAGRRCLDFAKKLKVIDGVAGGLQAGHEIERPWMACSVFCKRKDIGSFYTPRMELNELGMNAYLPDGTWCHREDGQEYYCRRHHCLPENFRFGKGLPTHDDYSDDVNLAMNAGTTVTDDDVLRYFSVDAEGKPLLTKLERRSDDHEDENDGDTWAEPKDYVELPEFLLRRREKLGLA